MDDKKKIRRVQQQAKQKAKWPFKTSQLNFRFSMDFPNEFNIKMQTIDFYLTEQDMKMNSSFDLEHSWFGLVCLNQMIEDIFYHFISATSPGFSKQYE